MPVSSSLFLNISLKSQKCTWLVTWSDIWWQLKIHSSSKLYSSIPDLRLKWNRPKWIASGLGKLENWCHFIFCKKMTCLHPIVPTSQYGSCNTETSGFHFLIESGDQEKQCNYAPQEFIIFWPSWNIKNKIYLTWRLNRCQILCEITQWASLTGGWYVIIFLYVEFWIRLGTVRYRGKKVRTVDSSPVRSANKSRDIRNCVQNEPKYVICVLFATCLYYNALGIILFALI